MNAPIGIAAAGGLTEKIPPPRRIAVVHDWLPEVGGAERVLGEILEVLPEAELFSLLDFIPETERGFLRGKTVHTSFLQHIPGTRRFYRSFLPLMPIAVEYFDLSGFDLIVSSSYAVAKGIITGPDQLHLCYCHSPVRYAWDLQEQYLRQTRRTKGIKGFVARAILHYIRLWDCRTPNGVDAFAANSRFIARRIWKVYRRRAVVIYPPVAGIHDNTLKDAKPRTSYLSLGRLVPYKRVDILIEAFRKMPGRKLLIIGDGPERNRLTRDLPPNVRLLGRLPQKEVGTALGEAKALLFAAEEDFGLVPVEAQAAGTPVIAYGKGGACESVIPGVTGVLFHEQTPEAVVRAVETSESMSFDPETLRRNALGFEPRVFRAALRQWIDAAWHRFSQRQNNAE
ncbi:MAG: glycosyltransferase family 4 protein [Verrucomicrobia bacterium]|nr:glycosyltransferase family 4 protein [Verrucomicrobiota bacterium]